MPDAISTLPPDGEDPWLTVPQVSAELKIHPATVRIWIKNGRLRAVRVGREWRVRRSEIDRALLLDASPAYGHAHSNSSRADESASARVPAPRQIADHIMTIAPSRGSES
jgi:excisionase family DNA binding protein